MKQLFILRFTLQNATANYQRMSLAHDVVLRPDDVCHALRALIVAPNVETGNHTEPEGMDSSDAEHAETLTCEICLRPDLPSKDALRKHKESHLGLKCLVSGCRYTGGFATFENLKRHAKKFHDDVPFVRKRYEDALALGKCGN